MLTSCIGLLFVICYLLFVVCCLLFIEKFFSYSAIAKVPTTITGCELETGDRTSWENQNYCCDRAPIDFRISRRATAVTPNVLRSKQRSLVAVAHLSKLFWFLHAPLLIVSIGSNSLAAFSTNGSRSCKKSRTTLVSIRTRITDTSR